ncbi:hypothetical protein ACIGNX_01360 [Actinosynnema sp. NPDC053489]|uniref:hypothetical protein n=1 Tax=Actinosynnema sp. NPDC053489 TaxID=3363916 RepID=UPI0037C68113
MRFSSAVQHLADDVVRALSGADHAFSLSDHIGHGAHRTAGLAAVWVLGADALAPFVVNRLPFTSADGEVLLTAARLFGDRPGDRETPLHGLRRWALDQASFLVGGPRLPLSDRPGALAAHEGGRDWPVWSARMAELAFLVLPRLPNPLHAQVATGRLDLARGLTQAILRQDWFTAARLARWLAAVPPLPGLNLDSALERVQLWDGHDAHARLHLAVARVLLREGER